MDQMKTRTDAQRHKTVVPGNPLDDAKLLGNTIASLHRSKALTEELSAAPAKS
jgi:geranylgeranyl reductase